MTNYYTKYDSQQVIIKDYYKNDIKYHRHTHTKQTQTQTPTQNTKHTTNTKAPHSYPPFFMTDEWECG